MNITKFCLLRISHTASCQTSPLLLRTLARTNGPSPLHRVHQLSLVRGNLTVKMPGVQLNHAPDETSYDDGAAFKSVKAYLEGGSDATLGSSAKALAGTLSGPPGTDGDDSHWSLYNLLISLAKQIPHDDPAMVRLVGVVDELSRSPNTALKESNVSIFRQAWESNTNARARME